ncbi:tetratricopeptide (TPR) repeat protein [Rhizobium sp. SG_E_25_P2]|uniref:FecR domain-containing protein n=1 Tax=Rhizobium sp. SG_E_25_P2 TaxID=2879942 RepID=UPI0024763A28|nr:FecR domain-containing protein [Rhizobium sp. SG_E_25_P2]MDH6267418.1 tetratricopeptide (TPR) repeat protein [Rhizobium sp. SG_E_25_P2]
MGARGFTIPALLGGALISASSLTVLADPLPRPPPAAGAVIARKSGEEVRFIDASQWRFVDVKQDLLAGDVLRTNAVGQLAILFSDRTQIRLGRNSSLVVKKLAASDAEETVFELQSGSIWARAERGGSSVKVETPAATAAIRGTDWTMTVAGARTALRVLDGRVSLSNPQGSVDVSQGQAAAATVGQAPEMLAIVDSDDREQMLFYLPRREPFERMSPTFGRPVEVRRTIIAISEKDAAARSAEEWVSLVEGQLRLDGVLAAEQTLAHLDDSKFSRSQRARLTLVKAIIAGFKSDYKTSARLFAEAKPGLDKRRQGIALYGGYYARTLADPNHVEPLPTSVDGPEAAFLRAYALGFLKDLRATIAEFKSAENRFPEDPVLPAYRAWIALLLNDRGQAKEAIARALALDPDEPVAMEVSSHFKSGIEGDLKGALASVERAVQIEPGADSGWNEVGNIQSELGGAREAEAAFRKAIFLDPFDAVSHTNLAIFYLDLDRVNDAKPLIDKALSLDPGFSPALVARGRYFLQTGKTDIGVEDLFAGSVTDPGYAQAQLGLAAAQYQKGDRVAADQALDNAERLDGNDPVVSAVRARMALDDYDSVNAIRYARDYVRLSRARGGYYGALGANQESGSTLNGAFRFQGLNAWAEYYSDAVFDAFSGSALIDQALRGSPPGYFTNYSYGVDIVQNATTSRSASALFQGLLLEPHMVSGPTMHPQLFRAPFVETTIGGGVVVSGSDVGPLVNAEVQAFSNSGVPLSIYANVDWERATDERTVDASGDITSTNEIANGLVYITASPTPYDRVIGFFNRSTENDDFLQTLRSVPPGESDIDGDGDVIAAGLGWSHTLAYHDVVNAALFYTKAKSDVLQTVNFFPTPGAPVPFLVSIEDVDHQAALASLGRTVETGDVTWRYGVEAGWQWQNSQYAYVRAGSPAIITGSSVIGDKMIGRAYLDALHDFAPGWKAEYGFTASMSGGGEDGARRLDPRAGFAWEPVNGQWLRLGYLGESSEFTTPTLSPIGVVGLQAAQVPVDSNGGVDTLAARWDAEWTRSVFTAVEYQHQEIDDFFALVPSQNFGISVSQGSSDRLSATGNLALGGGLGLSATAVRTWSENQDPLSRNVGDRMPFMPSWAGQVAATWVNENNLRLTVAGNYLGKRIDGAGVKLDDVWTLDAGLTWEPFGKRYSLELTAYNILDADFEISDGVPGWGPSFRGMFKARF